MSPPLNEQFLESKSLRLPKQYGQAVISHLKDIGQLNLSLKITSDDSYIHIPIVSKNAVEEMMNTKFSAVEWQIEIFEFHQHSTKPLQLRELIKLEIPDIDDSHLQTSYDQIGDIIIIDLKGELVNYKDVVGKILLDNHPAVKTVFRKSSPVSGPHRTRKLELIGGEYQTLTVHKEYGISIFVDVEKTYYSPRLATEHARISDRISSYITETKMQHRIKVLDLFGSLAPFGLHITSKLDIDVDTVDINDAVEPLITKSIKANKLVGNLSTIVADAFEFIEANKSNQYDFIIMNHPSGAEKYLNQTLSLLRNTGIVFYYKFIPLTGTKKAVKKHLRTVLDEQSRYTIKDIHKVRQYSPEENHVCIELQKNPDQIAHHSS